MIWQVKVWVGAEHLLTIIMPYLPHKIFHWGPHALNEFLDHNMQNLHRGLEGIWHFGCVFSDTQVPGWNIYTISTKIAFTELMYLTFTKICMSGQKHCPLLLRFLRVIIGDRKSIAGLVYI